MFELRSDSPRPPVSASFCLSNRWRCPANNATRKRRSETSVSGLAPIAPPHAGESVRRESQSPTSPALVCTIIVDRAPRTSPRGPRGRPTRGRACFSIDMPSIVSTSLFIRPLGKSPRHPQRSRPGTGDHLLWEPEPRAAPTRHHARRFGPHRRGRVGLVHVHRGRRRPRRNANRGRRRGGVLAGLLAWR